MRININETATSYMECLRIETEISRKLRLDNASQKVEESELGGLKNRSNGESFEKSTRDLQAISSETTRSQESFRHEPS
jgi:hypothetical protein